MEIITQLSGLWTDPALFLFFVEGLCASDQPLVAQQINLKRACKDVDGFFEPEVGLYAALFLTERADLHFEKRVVGLRSYHV